jgi:hypothetical protein
VKCESFVSLLFWLSLWLVVGGVDFSAEGTVGGVGGRGE